MYLNDERITIAAEDPHSYDAAMMIMELSSSLEAITGDSGQSSFRMEDLGDNRALFAVARDHKGEAIGCGALRPMDENTGEIKRMYARPNTAGVGSKLLHFLEQQARLLGYGVLRLETRRVNTRAISFYERNGYVQIANYGRYIGREDAVCFEKRLSRP